jgi:hypothetical protein
MGGRGANTSHWRCHQRFSGLLLLLLPVTSVCIFFSIAGPWQHAFPAACFCRPPGCSNVCEPMGDPFVIYKAVIHSPFHLLCVVSLH